MNIPRSAFSKYADGDGGCGVWLSNINLAHINTGVNMCKTRVLSVIGTVLILSSLLESGPSKAEEELSAMADPSTHSLHFDKNPKAENISIDTLSYVTPTGTTINDKIFRDGLGRQAYFRGWNVSGEARLQESGLKPFKSKEDAKKSIKSMAEMTGPNMIRFLISWEGTNPSPDVVDHAYLDQVAEQIKVAINHKIYVLIDFHTDLFSRYLFNQDSWFTGDGAPAWVLPSSKYGQEYCGWFCGNWLVNLKNNQPIRLAYQNFWNNDQFIGSDKKTRGLQDAFISQFGESLAYLKSKFTANQFKFVLGVDPFNEPYPGDLQGLTAKQWDNQKLQPFYDKTRAALDNAKWKKKWIYSEPSVWWNKDKNEDPGPTGGQDLDKQPGAGFVFNTHFYGIERDQGSYSVIENKRYLTDMDNIRAEARFRGNPAFISEFGATIGTTATVETIKAMYQGMEISNSIEGNGNMADFYSPPIPGTEWQWDHYYNNHSEYMNSNKNKLITAKDGWNDDNYSVSKNYSTEYNLDSKVVDRAYPRRVQGDLMSFYYNDLPADSFSKTLTWGAIRPNKNGATWLSGSEFAVLTWRGRRSNAPTEIYLPFDWQASNLAVLTDNTLNNGDLVKDAPLTQKRDEVALTHDPISRSAKTGNRLLVWNDETSGTAADIHFALAINKTGSDSQQLSNAQLETLRQDLVTALCVDHRSVVSLSVK